MTIEITRSISFLFAKAIVEWGISHCLGKVILVPLRSKDC